MMDDKPCLQCGGAIDRVKHGRHRKFCSSLCRATHWRLQNYDRDLASKRQYAEANREELRKKNLAHYYATKDDFLAKAKVRYQRTRLASPWRIPLNAARARSASRGWDCDLTEEWAIARWTGRCEVTDIPFVLGTPAGQPRLFSPSIDRVDPKLRYMRANCRFVLSAINSLKGEGTDADMLRIAAALVSRYEGNNVSILV